MTRTPGLVGLVLLWLVVPAAAQTPPSSAAAPQAAVRDEVQEPESRWFLGAVSGVQKVDVYILVRKKH